MATLKERTKVFDSMKTFFTEVYAEMKKIVWPTREALTQATLSVMAMVFSLAILMGIADFILRKVFDFLLS